MNKKIFVAVLALVILGFILILVTRQNKKDSEQSPNISTFPLPTNTISNFKATFSIYTYGTKRDFSSSMYHYQSEDAFIADDASDTVNIKKSNYTWEDFFKTLPFRLDSNCLITGTNQTFCTGENGTLLFYLNGVKDPNALRQKIQKGDHLDIRFEKGSI